MRTYRHHVLLALALCAACAGSAGAAQAATITTTFSSALMNLGTDQSTQDLKVLEPGDTPATLSGSYDPSSGAFTVPVSGFSFPQKTIDVIASSPGAVVATMNFAVTQPVTGTYQPTSGVMSTQLSLQVTIALSGSAGLTGTCQVSPIPLTPSTSGQYGSGAHAHTGSPFAPPSASGALAAGWSTLPAATTVVASAGSDPDQCRELIDNVDGHDAGNAVGGILLSGVTALGGLPAGGGGNAGGPAPGGGGGGGTLPSTGTTTSPAKLAITAPKSTRVKRGATGVYKVKVRNSGGATAKNVRVCLTAAKKAPLKFTSCQVLSSLKAGGTTTRTFKVTVTRKALRGRQYRLTFSVGATKLAARKASANLLVR